MAVPSRVSKSTPTGWSLEAVKETVKTRSVVPEDPSARVTSLVINPQVPCADDTFDSSPSLLTEVTR